MESTVFTKDRVWVRCPKHKEVDANTWQRVPNAVLLASR